MIRQKPLKLFDKQSQSRKISEECLDQSPREGNSSVPITVIEIEPKLNEDRANGSGAANLFGAHKNPKPMEKRRNNKASQKSNKKAAAQIQAMQSSSTNQDQGPEEQTPAFQREDPVPENAF